MKEKILRPIRETPSDWNALEKSILSLLKKHIYLPLAKELDKKLTVVNSLEDLISAITSGRIRYADNGFIGTFQASTSKELYQLGSKWDRHQSKWVIERTKLPMNVQEAISHSERKESQLKTKLLDKLSTISPDSIVDQFSPDKHAERAVKNVDRDFISSVKSITVTPTMSEKAKEKIKEDYSTNLKLSIRNFTEEQILELRKKIENHTFEGNRYKELFSYIEQSYGVAHRKAKFLARQETNLLASKVKETRYADVGIDDYEWRCVAGTASRPVRPMHKKLDKTRQKFSDPPVTSPTGAKNNPGEDFNCRCTAHPIVKF